MVWTNDLFQALWAHFFRQWNMDWGDTDLIGCLRSRFGFGRFGIKQANLFIHMECPYR